MCDCFWESSSNIYISFYSGIDLISDLLASAIYGLFLKWIET